MMYVYNETIQPPEMNETNVDHGIIGQRYRALGNAITRIGTHVFPLGRMIFARQESRVRMFF